MRAQTSPGSVAVRSESCAGHRAARTSRLRPLRIWQSMLQSGSGLTACVFRGLAESTVPSVAMPAVADGIFRPRGGLTSICGDSSFMGRASGTDVRTPSEIPSTIWTYVAAAYQAVGIALRATEGDENSQRPSSTRPQDPIPPHQECGFSTVPYNSRISLRNSRDVM
jgi:hypothetical protein